MHKTNVHIPNKAHVYGKADLQQTRWRFACNPNTTCKHRMKSMVYALFSIEAESGQWNTGKPSCQKKGGKTGVVNSWSSRLKRLQITLGKSQWFLNLLPNQAWAAELAAQAGFGSYMLTFWWKSRMQYLNNCEQLWTWPCWITPLQYS